MKKGVIIGIIVVIALIVVGGFFLMPDKETTSGTETSDYDKIALEYFQCVINVQPTQCPNDNVKGHTGECLEINDCASSFNTKLNELYAVNPEFESKDEIQNILGSCLPGSDRSKSEETGKVYIPADSINCLKDSLEN